MPQLTKAQLVDENIRLRAHADALEQRLASAVEHYRAQRARIAQLEAELAAPTRTPRAEAEAVAVVTQFTDRFGRVWEKTRVGNRATSRLVEGAAA